MLTKVTVKKMNNEVYINLTDHSDSVYKNTLWIVADLVKLGYNFIEIIPYGVIRVNTNDYKGVTFGVQKWLKENEIIENIKLDTEYTTFNLLD
mgnify:FL=1